MANQALSNTWTNLNTALSLTIGKTYRFQNIGGDQITLIRSESEPESTATGLLYDKLQPDKDETITISNNTFWWARSTHDDSVISVSEYEDKTALKPDPRTVLIMPFHTTENQTTITAPTVIGGKTITVDDPTGFTIGKFMLLFSADTNRFYNGYITGVAGSVITLDSPIDSVFPIGSNVDVGSTNLNVNGSISPVTFGVRSPTVGIPSYADIYRIMIQMTLEGAPDFGKFGDISAITNGIVLRFKDGTTQNIFNIKKNSEFALLSGDYTPYDASNPGIGVYGIGVRLTFSGQEKMGTVIRIGPGENLELIVQDNISTINSFNIIAEGNIYNF